MRTTRREALTTLAAITAGCTRREPSAEPAKKAASLPLSEFAPKSMLVVPETKVEKARHPVIDIHTHISWLTAEGVGHQLALSGKRYYLAPAEEIAKVMDGLNILGMANVTGGYGASLQEGVDNYDRKFPGRFFTLVEPMFDQVSQPRYATMQGDAVEEAHKQGAKGLKILKSLGMYLRENVTEGPLVKVDDPRFNPMWEACGALKMPVAIHVTDPAAFFYQADRFNERYEEMHQHPDWDFSGKDYPPKMEVLEARNRLLARHPKTQFLGLHVSNWPEDLGLVSQWMDKYPNLWVEIGARIAELGRQPRMARKFFEKYQDRILFGTDIFTRGKKAADMASLGRIYPIYYRFLETEDEYFNYSPGAVGGSGRWRIYGLGLPDKILRKVYNENSKRLLGLA